MQRRTKIVLAGAVVAAGFSAALWFRKPEEPAADTANAESPAVSSARERAARPSTNRAEVVSPTFAGRIEPVEGTKPGASAVDRSSAAKPALDRDDPPLLSSTYTGTSGAASVARDIGGAIAGSTGRKTWDESPPA